jgi:ribosomal protein S8
MKTALTFTPTKIQLKRRRETKEAIAELKAISRRLQRRLKVLRNGK